VGFEGWLGCVETDGALVVVGGGLN